ncbi:MAG: hypothetical protein ABII13_02175 [Patescibacteria group bacterium]|nr:hypothetical protein [Patescibacteria group bacterium]MBU2508989.1 hypothetical protein [Patescibacteria group bacterium]
MKKTWIITIIFAILVSLLEATFFTLLPSPWLYIHPVIAFSVLLVVLNKPKEAFVFAALSGFILDLFAVSGGYFSIARLSLIIAFVIFLSQSLFTNRSIYATVSLVAIARVLDRIWITVGEVLKRVLFKSNLLVDPLSSTVIILVWDIAIVAIGFILLVFFTRRMKIKLSKDLNTYGG